jgi:hypothetical protein
MYNFVVIAGGGRFGVKAYNELSSLSKKIIIIDKDPNCMANKMKLELIIEDAVKYISELLEKNIIPDLIVPAIPGNLIAKIFLYHFNKQGLIVENDIENFNILLSKISEDIVIKADEKNTTVILSYAKGFLCPDNCIPKDICPITKKKIIPLYVYVNEALDEDNLAKKIFISKIISNSIGAINGREIYEELNKIKNSLCIGTLCECHGIISFFKIRGKNNL